MLEMYDDIDWMDEPTETGWMPAPEQVANCEIQIQIQIHKYKYKYKYKYKCKYKYTTETGWMPAPEQVASFPNTAPRIQGGLKWDGEPD